MKVKVTDLSGEALDRFTRLALGEFSNTSLSTNWQTLASNFMYKLKGLEFWILEQATKKYDSELLVYYGARYKGYQDFDANYQLAICKAAVGGTFGEEVDTDQISYSSMKTRFPGFVSSNGVYINGKFVESSMPPPANKIHGPTVAANPSAYPTGAGSSVMVISQPSQQIGAPVNQIGSPGPVVTPAVHQQHHNGFTGYEEDFGHYGC